MFCHAISEYQSLAGYHSGGFVGILKKMSLVGLKMPFPGPHFQSFLSDRSIDLHETNAERCLQTRCKQSSCQIVAACCVKIFARKNVVPNTPIFPPRHHFFGYFEATTQRISTKPIAKVFLRYVLDHTAKKIGKQAVPRRTRFENRVLAGTTTHSVFFGLRAQHNQQIRCVHVLGQG